MTRVLLDHPWPLNETLNARSGGFNVLLEFDKFVKRKGLTPVRFMEQKEYDNAKQLLGRSNVAAQILRISNHLIRFSESIISATPDPEPNPPLGDYWKRGLRDELDHLENWRNPQIIFPEVRRSAWLPATDEVEIKCADRNVTVFRVLASLENYETHPFAVKDLDPWRHLEWLKRSQPGARTDHPCRLPKPPILDNVPVEQLFQLLDDVRKDGWIINERYYFIPPANCHLDQVGKTDWRNGAAFVRKSKNTRKGIKTGPVDFEGRIWAWDIFEERHWDVQLLDGTRINISHDGRKI